MNAKFSISLPKKTTRSFNLAWVAALIIGTAASSQAADGTWVGDAASMLWSQTGRWAGGIIADGAGATANITTNIANNRNVTIDGAVASRTLGILNIGDANTTHAYTLAANNSATLTLTNIGVNAQINQISTSFGDTISAPLVLNSDLDIVNASTTKTLTFSGAGSMTTTTTGTRTINNLGTAGGAVTIAASIGDGSGTLAVVQNAANSLLTMNAAANTFTGPVTLNAGILRSGGNSGVTAFGTGASTLILNAGELQLGSVSGRNYARNTTVNGNVTMTSDKSAAGGNGFLYYFGTLNISNTTLTVQAGSNPTNGTAAIIFGDVALAGSPVFCISNNAAGAGGLLNLGGAITDGGNARGLIKTGNGTLSLSGTNTYTGGTTVSNGTLLISGVLGNSVVAIKSGTVLASSGTNGGVIMGPVTIDAGATLASLSVSLALTATTLTTNISTLTISNDLNLAGTTVMWLDRTNSQTASQINVSGTFNAGGTLTVLNVGEALQAGDTFTLFGLTAPGSSFSVTNLPSLDPGLEWNTSQLGVNGTLTVASTVVNPPVFLPLVAANGGLIFSGTNGTAGGSYYVLSSTNLTLARTNWTVIATNTFGAGGVFSFTNAISPAGASEFFILQLP